MPRISRFYGVVVAMYHNDHAPPHFHAKYAEHEASFEIETLACLEGGIPRRAQALVLEWAALHRDELEANWQRARDGTPLVAIAPLE